LEHSVKGFFVRSAVFCRQACGGVYTAESGNITSPYYPDPYPNNKECVYIIRQPEGSTITLSFQRFNVEASSMGHGPYSGRDRYRNRCIHDYLEV